ncbi:hypothetical protein GCM10009678_66110 [Actinomadura kijaniata]|uniref:Quercetin dioxygenase-like cupin family protein n=1 Tax=Actinomadura namibiensis TaxID=182080 RepID=A0A7W3LYA1_ACTNM|nr:cupin domain-containing protein [Actinomadura namibiensis]MBA8956513.1 quercetin dioxygenase-like cupin family protein [Actinomadura namibiensis]
MPVIHHADARRTETPNGVMTTFASPAQGGTGIVLCRSALHPDAEGPLHVADAEQIWTVVAGGGDVEVDGDRRPIAEGDTVVLRAGRPRRFLAGPGGLTAVVAGPAGTKVAVVDRSTLSDACDLAPREGERLTPPWFL